MPYPPLATLYAMSFLRQAGFEVKLFDTMFCDSPSAIEPEIDLFKPDVLVSYDDGFNYLTKMCLTNMREACFHMQRYAHSKGCKVITSSSDSSDHFEMYLAEGADAIAIGEGEQTVLELCEAFKDKRTLEDISGIAFLKSSSAIKTAPRSVLRNLDDLPEPAWDLLDIHPYQEMWLKIMDIFRSIL